MADCTFQLFTHSFETRIQLSTGSLTLIFSVMIAQCQLLLSNVEVRCFIYQTAAKYMFDLESGGPQT